MSTIGNYSTAAVDANVKLLGTDADGETRNYLMSAIKTFNTGSSGGVTTTSGAYIASVSDVNSFIYFTSGADRVNLPDSTDTSFPIGGQFQIQLTAAGYLDTIIGSGCTLYGTVRQSTQYGVRTVKKLTSTIWTVY